MKYLLCGLLLTFSMFANAQTQSPVGFWQTVSDVTGKPAGVAQLYMVNGELQGRVVDIYRQGGNKPTDRCIHCRGALHNRPIMCMIVVAGMRHFRDHWSGGKILDPKKGKVYRCTMKVINHGRFLKVRGYIGFSLFGRTQTWEHLPDYQLKHCKPL